MDLHKLNVFVTVSQSSSFTAASKLLHIAQSAVSHDIAELEREFGAKLFDRTKTGVHLTPAGEVFFAEACKMIAIAEGARQRIAKMSGGEGGQLLFGFVSEQMIEPLLPVLKRFYEDHPNVQLHFNSYNSISLASLIENKALDLGIDRSEAFIKRDDLEWRELYRDPFYVAFSDAHPLAKEKKITLDRIEGETILLMSREANPGFFDVIQRFCLAHGMTPLLNATSNERMATLFMARIGMGVALLTKQFLKVYDYPGLKTAPLEEEDAFHSVGIVRRKNAANQNVDLFLEALDAYIRALPDSRIAI
ncbi:MAG: LysR family transcriptional regulator [Clostridiales Family XIII bacterium]|jgi:DNA-binding transcriptional LysR family regulator|nr:LysR family transcriptional regulator [Clostridiales Family XIII bacterium]